VPGDLATGASAYLGDGADGSADGDEELKQRVEVQDVTHDDERHQVEGVTHRPILEGIVKYNRAVVPAVHGGAKGHVCSDGGHARGAHHALKGPLPSQRVCVPAEPTRDGEHRQYAGHDAGK
jgi:hypothetical protein